LGGERGVGRVGGGNGGHVWGDLNGCVLTLVAIGRGAGSGNRAGAPRPKLPTRVLDHVTVSP
jgi:hypothetical protein